MSYDAIIVGAGAAGLMAAIRAARLNARVLLLEIADGTCSDFAKSGGGLSAAGTRFQAHAGIEDSPNLWTQDIERKTGGKVEYSIVTLVTDRARDAIHFMADEIGLDLHVAESVPIAGHSVCRTHRVASLGGRELAEEMTLAARRLPAIDRIDDAKVIGLICDRAAVSGVRATILGNEREFRAAHTVLACGGFAGNRAMLREYAPEIEGALHIGNPYNVGAGIIWARELGAATSFLDSYQGHGHITADRQGRLGLGVTTLGAILVDRHGLRFVREDIGPSELAAFVLGTPGGTAVEIYDQHAHELALGLPAYRQAAARGVPMSASTPEALAAIFEIPVASFLRTFEDANRAARGEIPDPLAREQYGRQLTPPLWGVRITGGLAHTQGGLLVDTEARVLCADGSHIAGLLAAGGTVTGISGHGAAGYSSGNGLAQAFALGMIAAETIAGHSAEIGAGHRA